MQGKQWFILFSITLMITACQEEETPAPSLFVETALQPYFDSFVEEAAQRGRSIDLTALEIEGIIEEIDGNVIGQCRSNSNLPNVVAIDQSFWNSASQLRREMVIFHELGHCALQRDHLDTKTITGTCISIMQSGQGNCRNAYSNSTRAAYLDELFNH